jgi:hypothetical protein
MFLTPSASTILYNGVEHKKTRPFKRYTSRDYADSMIMINLNPEYIVVHYYYYYYANTVLVISDTTERIANTLQIKVRTTR